ncbi:hypothetical protein [Bradyrhizobium sp. STM 3566]|uniref:hypothetical protein n=1 Tax=Bradyrhizobium sp. STM 3566 TaxID=578928 RepID=UPI00388DA478
MTTTLSPIQAREALNQKMADSAWAERYEQGDATARQEFSELTRASAAGSGAQWSMAGADLLRSRGFSPSEIENSLSGKTPSDDEYQTARTAKQSLMSSKDFQQRYSDGEPDALGTITRHNDVITRWESANRGRS